MSTSKHLLFSASLFFLPLTLAGCFDEGPAGDDEAASEDETASEDEGADEVETDTGEETAGEIIDTDQDGLSDEEEAMLGTDPLRKDTDNDNYWDSWELIEGTDPLDASSRIYIGSWPYNPDKEELDQGSWEDTGKQKGKSFPREVFLDQYGDTVDVYDFTNFTVNSTKQPAVFIMDLSAQWCTPCHNVANWIAGNDDSNNEWIQEIYPTVREKVHGLFVWWITFVVQDANGGDPSEGDIEAWFQAHWDPYIPLFLDEGQKVLSRFGGDSFPHFFLLNSEMKIEYFPDPSHSTNANPYPAIGLIDTQVPGAE
ncbi:hypothetical protein G6O69_20385 [Pseudenhygromyxa sp. WMMC2535]|uniref:hypothetical protein n=1 Tax=Pseudenhygromyxa sp. WMMC2535 TaxID=2712867 RepID=UPI001553BE66|nr:hypothetical protein [Pseudenhygromyxa sp. WMMC2535]NVB40212.1 hypothetical protein [Pseudenhygromyxa sp. WMMC2535]